MTEQTPDFFTNTFARGEASPPAEPSVEPKEPPAPPLRRKPIILPYILFTIFILTVLPGPLFFLSMVLPGPLKEAKTILISRGTSAQEIAKILDKNNILIHPLLFRAVSRLMAEDHLQAGEYRFEPGQNVIDVAVMMRDGKTVLRQFTAPEGLTSAEIVSALQAVPVLTGTIAKTPEEGALLPETYRYTFGDTRASLLERMKRDQTEMLKVLWNNRAPNLPVRTPREAVILASIVEKETGKMPSERAKVAGVFYNRLRQRMPLQTDPTVIYALTKGKGPLGRALTKADLATPSPYNTYVNAGLPPGPICNPGKAALEAVLHPDSHDFLYFVANGTGGHTFAKTLEEHNKNVSKWLSLSRP